MPRVTRRQLAQRSQQTRPTELRLTRRARVSFERVCEAIAALPASERHAVLGELQLRKHEAMNNTKVWRRSTRLRRRAASGARRLISPYRRRPAIVARPPILFPGSAALGRGFEPSSG
jgi:ParB-like chromosome segregation protein Spo0J